MNLNLLVSEFSQGRESDKQWVPLITQQLRLRHVTQIQAFNLQSEPRGSFYFTLHVDLTSSPFFSSKIINVKNPKWPELYLEEENGALSAVVIKIWQACKTDDKLVLTWGLNFSGLVHLGNKITDLHPCFFKNNTVIFFMQNAYFTSQECIQTDSTRPLPFAKYLNLLDNKRLYRRIAVKDNIVQPSYSLDKLKTLQNLQLKIKTKKLEVQHLKERIKHATLSDVLPQEPQIINSGASESNYMNNIRFAPQLLTMTSLNKMLHEKPTQSQKDEMERKAKEIEKHKFKIRMLEQEKERHIVKIAQQRDKKDSLEDSNEERNCDLMSRYHILQRGCERLKDYKKNLLHNKEVFCHLNTQLHYRQVQLLKELLFIYPIERTAHDKYTILGVHLPYSHLLTESTEAGVSIALGYVTHILCLSSIFLQVPLRHPMTHLGSRSVVTNQVGLLERECFLFTRAKDFTYGVYLLNKNLAQLRWLVHLQTTDLRPTLANLRQFLQGHKGYRWSHTPVFSSLSNFEYNIADDDFNINKWTSLSMGPGSSISDSFIDSIRQEKASKSIAPSTEITSSVEKVCRSRRCGRSLSEILAIPEAYLNKRISREMFEKYISSRKSELNSEKNDDSCDSECSYKTIKINRGTEEPVVRRRLDSSRSDSIEQGTDPLDSNVNLSSVITKSIAIHSDKHQKSALDVWQDRRISRSVGSYSNDENEHFLKKNGSFSRAPMDMGSDPILCTTCNTTAQNQSETSQTQQELLERWLESGTELIGNDDLLRASLNDLSSPLTARTDRLLSVTSFNLVKPKM